MSEDFLVITSIGDSRRRLIWNTKSKLFVDHPRHWYLVRRGHSIEVREKNTNRNILLAEALIDKGEGFEIPPSAHGRPVPMQLKLIPLRPIPAAYSPTPETVDSGKGQLFIYHGVKKFLLGFKRSPRGEYRAYVNNRLVFELERGRNGYEITPKIEGVVIQGATSKPLESHSGKTVAESELTTGTIKWGEHWWRINRVIIPPALPPKALALEEEVTPESLWYKRVVKTVAGAYLVFALVVLITPHTKKVVKKEPPQTKVSLKAPKFVPKKPEPLPMPPPEPVKQVALPQAPPKVVKAEPLPPKPVSSGGAPMQAEKNSAAQTATAKKQLSDSLNFLSPSQNKAAPISELSSKANTKYAGSGIAGSLVDNKKGETLRNMAKNGKGMGDGPIDTNSARNMQSNVPLEDGGARRKALNGVQGKVSVAALYDPNAAGELGSSLSNKSISMSGAGTISQGLIEKTLAKYVDRLQYCYEKALLSDASLAGTVVMQWTVTNDGSARDVKVVKTQIPNAPLQQCISKEIAAIRFPAPAGGAVTIKYPLSFSSASL